MSGGAYEYVMSNISSVTSNYTFYPSTSGFSTSWYIGNQKYVNTYAYDVDNEINQTAYNRGRLGDATVEVLLSTGGTGGWYSDYAHFSNSIYAWFERGGYYDNGSGTGLFYFYSNSGANYGVATSRMALVSLSS